jgi:hypothetical protein
MMHDIKMDLGKKLDDMSVAPPASSPLEDKKYYPCLYLDSDDPYLKDLPDSGEMLVKFRVKSREERTDSKGDMTYCANVEVLQIVGVDGKEVSAPATKKGAEATSSALDALAEALLKKKSEKSGDSDEGY